jgi:hypothetical protein
LRYRRTISGYFTQLWLISLTTLGTPPNGYGAGTGADRTRLLTPV